jgi:hypothetical protein
MGFHLGKFVHTQTGKTLMSILLGFGLASLFRTVCKGKNCSVFRAPPFSEIKDKIYKASGKCVKYKQVAAKCDSKSKVVEFE